MKEKYMTPEMEIINFTVEDVITTSNVEINGGDNDLDIIPY